MAGKYANAVIWRRIRWPVGKITALENVLPSDLNEKFIGLLLATTTVLCRGVAKLVKAPDFDSGIRRFESFHPCQITHRGP